MACSNTKDKELLDAVRSENFERFKVLLDEGADINVTYNGGNTLLHLSRNGKITKELLRRGLSVHAKNSEGETPLIVVVKGERGRTVIEELLKYGADVSYTDRQGNTPLHLAIKAFNPCKEVIRNLVKYGSNIYIENWMQCGLYDNHSSPLLLAGFSFWLNFETLLAKYRIVKNFSNYPKELELMSANSIMTNFPSYGNDIYSKEFKLIYANSTVTDFPSYVNDCVAEIRQMKTLILQDDISLFDVIENSFSFESLFSKPKGSLCFIPSTRYSVPKRYVHCDNELSMKLKNMDSSTFEQYPIYSEVILDAIKPYVERANLLKKLKMVDFYTELESINQVDLTTNKVNRTVQVGLRPNKMNIKANSAKVMDDVQVNPSDEKTNKVDPCVNQSDEETIQVYVKTSEVDIEANQAALKRVSLNYLCVYRISEYLSNEDLLNFIIATYVCNDSTLVSDGAKPDATTAWEDSVGNPAKRARLE